MKGFAGGAGGKEASCQYRRHERHGFNPWIGKIPWRRERQPTPIFLSGEFHGQRSHRAADRQTRLSTHTCAHTHTHTQSGVEKGELNCPSSLSEWFESNSNPEPSGSKIHPLSGRG